MVFRLKTIKEPSTLCVTFERLSSAVWTDLGDARNYKLSFGEESVTDRLLLELKRQHSTEIEIVQFNRRQEARSGADWAWWFQGKKWLGMRVQAKKLYPSRRYEALGDHVGNSKKLQIDVLLKQSKEDNLYPMYCFYNFWDVAAYPLASVPFNCGTFMPREHLMGCMLASAANIKRLAVKLGKDDLATVAQCSFPWLCLVCCPSARHMGDDLASSVLASLAVQDRSQVEAQERESLAALQGPEEPPLRERGASAERAQRRRRQRRPRQLPTLIDDPPRYVHATMHGRVPDDDLPQGVGGVAVFRDVPRENTKDASLRVGT